MEVCAVYPAQLSCICFLPLTYAHKLRLHFQSLRIVLANWAERGKETELSRVCCYCCCCCCNTGNFAIRNPVRAGEKHCSWKLVRCTCVDRSDPERQPSRRPLMAVGGCCRLARPTPRPDLLQMSPLIHMLALSPASSWTRRPGCAFKAESHQRGDNGELLALMTCQHHLKEAPQPPCVWEVRRHL